MKKSEAAKSDKKSDKSAAETPKVSALMTAQVRISPDEATYVPMHNEEGWFQAVGAPRLPELHKDVRTTLSLAVKTGHALYGNAGGLRILKNANGKGGVCFIEKKNMQSGNEFYLLGKEITKEKLEKAKLVFSREAKGFYVKPRNTEGELAFETIAEKFSNNHAPMNFVAHDWPGYVVQKEEKKAKKEKVVEKKEAKSETKVPSGKVLTKTEGKAPKEKKVVKTGKAPKTTEEPQAAVG